MPQKDSSRTHADRDRRRRAEWARRIAADQRLAAQRAATIQKDITRQIRSIQIASDTTLGSAGRLQGAGVVTAILPNGRRSRMRIVPAAALIREINRLRVAQADAIRTNSRVITALAAAQAEAVKRLVAEQIKCDKDLAKRLVEGESRLNQRITRRLGRKKQR